VKIALMASGPSVYWYATRSTGAVALLLLTAAVVLGVLDTRRVSSPRWPRFAIDSMHRSASMLAIAFLAVHILTAVLDSFASISLLDAVIPFAGSYRPFWLGLGAVSLDLLLAVAISSAARRRIGYGGWRAIHWLAYASWPLALVHSLGTGSDVKSWWLLALALACMAAVLGAILARVSWEWPRHRGRRRAALWATGAFSLFLLVWVPLGPLGSEWARRSGTPQALLAHNHAGSEASQ
jgi:sulfoxide reductase heme-binding subunit YedZ